MPMNKTRVLVIDNDPQVLEDLDELLTQLGYICCSPTGAGEELMENARQMAKIFRPHVAIVDLRLVDDAVSQLDGFKLLKDLKPARCIIYSAFPDVNSTRDAFQKYKAFDLIQKSDEVEKLLDAVDRAARELSAARREMSFGGSPACSPERVMEGLRLFDPAGPSSHNLAADLLSILFPEEQHIQLEPVESDTVAPNPVLRGRTIVMKVQRKGRLEVELVKFAPAEKIAREVKNYTDYIRLNLGGHFRPNLETHGAFYELGGAVYTFLGHNELQKRPMQTLAQAYQHHGNAALVRPLDHFFKEVWRGLYQGLDEGQKEYRLTPYEAYDAFLGLTKKLKAPPAGGPTISIPGLEQRLPNPFTWLYENRTRGGRCAALRYAITHGDLHAGNLLIDETCEHAWTIDFERTGEGPILRDFVELEVDIATRLVDAANPAPRDFLELAAALCAPAKTGAPLYCTAKMSAEAQRGLALIHHLRGLAQEIAGVYDAQEYTWGVLCDAVFVALLEAPGSPRYHRAVMLAAAACLSLSPAEFPPPAWQTGAAQPISDKDA